MPSRTATDYPLIAAKDIIARAGKAVGPYWLKLSGSGHMVECRAILCMDMLRNRDEKVTNAWWISVNARLLDLLLPPPEDE